MSDDQSDSNSEASDMTRAKRARTESENECSTSTGSASTLYSPKYTFEVLELENRVTQIYYRTFKDYPSFDQRFHDIYSKTTESLIGSGSDDEASILKKAHDLAEAIDILVTEERTQAGKYQWLAEMDHIWQFFNMKKHFRFEQSQWWAYDEAMRSLIPGRKNLKPPKPDYAFGLKCDLAHPNDDFRARAAVNVGKFTDPEVDIVCGGLIIMPFLVGETKTLDGSLSVAERQMCNALVKAHDNLGALDLSDQLVIYSFVHAGKHMILFSSISVLEMDERDLTFVKKIFVIKVAEFLLDEEGALKFLKFIKFVKAYAMEIFQKAVDEALNTFIEKIRRAGLTLWCNL